MTYDKKFAAGMLFARVLHNKQGAVLVGILLFLLMLMITVYTARLDNEQQYTALQERVLEQASDLRTRIELEINTSLNLTMGSVVYVSFNPDITQVEFARFAREIIQRAPYVKNLGLARDNIITHIYPLEGNEQAMGLRYAENPQQWPAVERAIASRKAVLAGPVNLVQGGQGLISRIPVFLDDMENRYWGIASVVILMEAFLQQVGLNEFEQDLRVALRGIDAWGLEGGVFYGDETLFDSADTVLLKITLPEGSWYLAAAPHNGWVADHQRQVVIHVMGIGIALLLSILVSLLLIKNIDLNEKQRIAEEAIIHKNRFFSYMAHELRTPLTAIYGAVRMLDSDVVPMQSDKWKQLTHNAYRNCQRLKWLIDDILDLRKLESGNIEYKKSAVSIQEIVHEAMDEIMEYSRQFNTEVQLSHMPEAPQVLQVDSRRIQQVVVNLLSNAIKHSPEHERVEIQVNKQHDHIRVEVHDFGKGIDEDKLRDIFKEFSQIGEAGENSKRIVASTGLGLSISKHIILDHGGQIGCYNKVGQGAVFYFELPVMDQPADSRDHKRA